MKIIASRLKKIFPKLFPPIKEASCMIGKSWITLYWCRRKSIPVLNLKVKV
jgi:hypothetical protein